MSDVTNLVLQARAEDEVVVGNLPAPGHQHMFGLPVDAEHLPCHHADAGAQRQLGQVAAAVSMTAGGSPELSLAQCMTGMGPTFI